MPALIRAEGPYADAVWVIFIEPRTPHAFADKPVPDEELRAIWDLIKWTPTSINSEPMGIVWVRTVERKSRLLPDPRCSRARPGGGADGRLQPG
jgi:nitroreductase